MFRLTSPRSSIVALALVSLSRTMTADAQGTLPASSSATVGEDSAHKHHKTLFTSRDAALAAAFTGLTVAMFPIDQHIAGKLQNPDVRANKFLDKSARGVEWVTTPGSFFIGGGMYAVGRLGGYKELQDIGWHGTEAILLGSSITGVLKGILGRARPYVDADTNSRDFELGRGFGRGQFLRDFGSGDYQSFPSGHTTTAFAAAASVTSEVRRAYPGAVWIVAPVMYGGATLVGLSRMYHNNHWASDVVLGAAVGTFSGLKVERYTHNHPDNMFDRIMLGATIVPNTDGGGVVAFSLPVP